MNTRNTTMVSWLLLLGLIVWSCEKDLELELKEKGEQLVLFSFLTPDSAFSVHLSKSVPHFSVDDFERIYEGNITVYKNEEIVDDFIFPFDRTWAVRDSIGISEGDAFRVEALDGEGHQVSGETVVPEAVPLTLADDASTIFIDQPGGAEREVFRCRLEIPDPGDENNFYQLLVFEEICSMNGQDTTCTRTKIDYPKNDPVFYVREQEESLIGSVDFEGCFSDHLFDGEVYQLDVHLPVEYASPPSGSSVTRKIQFVLVSHTRAYYNYLRSRVVAEYGYELPVVDPVRIYSNVEHGLGVVAGYSASTDSLVFNGK
ncbi:MAG: DUF4249 domain-containing protein [Marinilabiliaceae bacterium]